MDDAKYIELVKSIFSDTADNIERVTKIAALSLPSNADPLIVLIHGDCSQLENATDYDKNYDPASPDEAEITELDANLSNEIMTKLDKYIADWDSGNSYHYQFGLKATYGALTNDRGDIEYIEVRKSDVNTKTVSGAIEAAKEWQSHLLERVVLYLNQEIGHKLISVKPTYVIRDNASQEIATGTLQGDDEFWISTWLNQDLNG